MTKPGSPYEEPQDLFASQRIARVLRDKTVRSRPPIPWAGWLLLLLALPLWLLLIVLGFQAPGEAVGFTIPLGCFLAIFMIRAGLRLLAKSALELIEQSHMRPVLLLRAFEFDHVPVLRSLSGYDYQDTLVQELKKCCGGPIVAVASPRTHSGRSARYSQFYISDDDWQEVVRFLMTECERVVLIIGRSVGIQWEVEEAIRTVPSSRLLLDCGMLLEDDDPYRVVAYLNRRDWLPSFIVDFPEKFRYLSFDDDWKPILSTSLPWSTR